MTRFTRRRSHSPELASHRRADPPDPFGGDPSAVACRHRRNGACLSCLREADAAGAFSKDESGDSPDYCIARANERQSAPDNPGPHSLGGDI